MLIFFEPLMKLLRLEKIETDNLVFRLHYKVTVPIFILFSAMLTAKQYFGDPIECSVKGVETHIVNTYCWTHGTYTVKALEHVTRRPPTVEELEHLKAFGHDGQIAPGVRTHDPNFNRKQYYIFYQWVCFVIFIQALMFYLPRFYWKTFVEKGRMKFLTSGTRDMITDEDEMNNRAAILWQRYNKLNGKNDWYAYRFFSVEIVNFFNVIGQFYLTDMFLHHRFSDYGMELWRHYQYYETSWNPMDEVFPKIAKCQFNKHGPGGGIQNHDALCMLPLNIVNEKIYLVMWFWMIILAVATGVAILYRLVCIFVPSVRTIMLMNQNNRWSVVANACRKRPYGDWFILRQMSKNVEEEVFDRFLILLSVDEDFRYGGKGGPADKTATLMSKAFLRRSTIITEKKQEEVHDNFAMTVNPEDDDNNNPNEKEEMAKETV